MGQVRAVSTFDRATAFNVTRWGIALVGVYTILLLGAELALVFVGLITGTLLHAMLVTGLLLWSVLPATPGDATASPAGDVDGFAQLAPVLALISVLRLVSVVIPIESVAEIYWYAMMGAPLLLGAFLTARQVGFTPDDLGLTISWDRWQFPIAASGVPLGIAAYGIIGEGSSSNQLVLSRVVIGSLILVVCSGFLEEVIFRALLQRAGRRLIGRFVVPWAGVVFAIMYLGAHSLPFVVFIGLTGAFFGWCFQRTSSLWGIVIAHSLMNIGLLLIYPVVLTPS